MFYVSDVIAKDSNKAAGKIKNGFPKAKLVFSSLSYIQGLCEMMLDILILCLFDYIAFVGGCFC